MRKFDKILVSGAMDSEVLDLMEELDEPQKLEIAGYTLVVGTIGERTVGVLKTEIGMVNASVSTAIAVVVSTGTPNTWPVTDTVPSSPKVYVNESPST